MKSLLIAIVMLFSGVAFAEDCFDSTFAHSWDYDDSTEVLSVYSFDETYEVKFFGPCLELPWATTIGFKSFTPSMVCRGDDVVVFNGFNEAVEVCHISSVVKTAK